MWAKSFMLTILVAFALEGAAGEPDFYVVPKECKIVSVSLIDGKLAVMPGDQPTYACSRSGKKFVCTVTYKGDSKPIGDPTQTYDLIGDSPPFLYFASSNRATTFSVRLDSRQAAMTTRFLDDGYVAEKVCSGSYITSNELENLPAN